MAKRKGIRFKGDISVNLIIFGAIVLGMFYFLTKIRPSSPYPSIPQGIYSTGISPISSVSSSGISSTGIGSTGVSSSGISSTGIGSTGIGSTGIGSSVTTGVTSGPVSPTIGPIFRGRGIFVQ